MGLTVDFNNSDWASIYGKLKKAQRRLRMVEKLLTNMGATVQERTMIYKAVVQTMLICGSESCVAKDAMLKVLEGFHHIADWRIAGVLA